MVILLATELTAAAQPASEPHCGIGTAIELGGDIARASDHVGAIRMSGTGLGLRMAAEWRVGRLCLGGSISARATSGLTHVGDGLKSSLDDAALLQIGGAVGASFEWSPRWWVRADLGPTWLIYVSPRVVAFATGVNLSAAVERDLAQVGSWVFGLGARLNTEIVPDGDQTWLLASFALAGAVRRNW